MLMQELLDGLIRARINVGNTAAATVRTKTAPIAKMDFLDMCGQIPNRSTHQRRQWQSLEVTAAVDQGHHSTSSLVLTSHVETPHTRFGCHAGEKG